MRSPPFRADHVGSLLRPLGLREAFRRYREGEIGAGEFRAAQEAAIRDVVALQEGVGLQSVTDGEFRRPSYWAHFVEAVEGLTVEGALFDFRDAKGERMAFTAPHVGSTVRRRRPICGEEFDFLCGVTQQTPKITMPSPSTMHFWRGPSGIDTAAYESLEAFFADLAVVYHEEIADLAARGATYVQFDEVALAMLCDPDVEDAVRGRGEDPDRLVTAYVDAINAALADRPAGMVATMHLCRGNYKGKWMAAGGYEPVAERVFAGTDVEGVFLEFDSPRAGDFRPLRFVPETKTVVLGLVSTKTPQLEDPDELAARIDEASAYVDLDRLGISPQCGFASTAAGNPVTQDDQRRKLALVVDVAQEVWDQP